MTAYIYYNIFHNYKLPCPKPPKQPNGFIFLSLFTLTTFYNLNKKLK